LETFYACTIIHNIYVHCTSMLYETFLNSLLVTLRYTPYMRIYICILYYIGLFRICAWVIADSATVFTSRTRKLLTNFSAEKSTEGVGGQPVVYASLYHGDYYYYYSSSEAAAAAATATTAAHVISAHNNTVIVVYIPYHL